MKSFVLALMVMGIASASPIKLFEPAGFAKAGAFFLTQEVTDHLLVSPNWDRIVGLRGGETIQIDVASNRKLMGRVARIDERGGGNRTIFARIDGDEEGQMLLVLEANCLSATIQLPDSHELFSLRFAGNGLYAMCRQDAMLFPPCDEPIAVHSESGEVVDGSIASTENVVIDVLVAYTPQARDVAGSTNQMLSRIQLMIDESNQAYSASLMPVRLRLVHRVEATGYTESSNFSTNLSRLRNTSDGHMDDVHTLREQYSADMVALIVSGGSACGVAYLMSTLSTDFRTSAFSVSAIGCATGYYTFGHELGHNQGSHHDRANAGTALYPYSYGWRFYGTNGTQYRTILAYSPGTRIQRFSNPNVNFQGTPTGILNSEENARSITNAAPTVRQFYAPRPGDVDRNGCVDDLDLAMVLDQFGDKAITLADVDSNGVVDDRDLAIVLNNFGSGCI
ncbi:MAG: hypothetical protein HUU60_07270 [Armatimonadetes bacterium]|nr:hypothetical protein [Armatimonadota bacterium]